MMATLTIRDETAFGAGNFDASFTLGFPTQFVTARELITKRVQVEVDNYNQMQPELFQGLMQPADAERELNGFRMMKRKWIDAETQIERALEAFARNGFVLLVNDKQVEDLDEMIAVAPETTVTFLKLVPLVGG